jgi:hypothetical protein
MLVANQPRQDQLFTGIYLFKLLLTPIGVHQLAVMSIDDVTLLMRAP